jgi:signal recognition particle receptor subunit alpha
MFELLCIFTSGGLVLWHKGAEWTPLNLLISQVLLQQKTSLTQYQQGEYVLKWKVSPQLDLVFAAVYRHLFPLVLVEDLLTDLQKQFLRLHATGAYPHLKEVPIEDHWQPLYERWQARVSTTRGKPQETVRGDGSIVLELTPSPTSPGETGGVEPAKKKPEKAKKPVKTLRSSRTWGISDKVSKSQMQSLDHSSELAASQGKRSEYIEGNFSDSGSEEEVKESGLLSWISGSMRSIIGNKQLTDADLEGVITHFKSHLISKNVAEVIADQLCTSVKCSLLNTTTESFTTVNSTVKSAVRVSLQRLLTPKQSIDVLHDALTAKSRGLPYVVVFVGVNGVGKSTSLAKVAHYLKTKGDLSVMIAACDTFRSGAIEQVRTHANTLEIPLFEKGYGKDPAVIAREAIKSAVQSKIDVVLVDTAGRMQHNEPLMQALANLVSMNSPNLVLFVGEALVGNDGVDQLMTFNRALLDRTTDGRGIDGVLLTKFDTVDDKMGAAISMVYSTGKPIVFVGTGERYGNLRRLHVQKVVTALLS